MKAKIIKSVLLVLSLVCILLCKVQPTYAMQQGTNGDELQVAEPEQLVIQLGESWAGVEFELKTDAGMYPGTIPVGEDGVLRLEIEKLKNHQKRETLLNGLDWRITEEKKEHIRKVSVGDIGTQWG